MNKNIKIILGLVLVAVVAGILVFYHPNPKTPATQEQVYVPPAPGPEKLPPFATVKITRTEGSKIYFAWMNTEKLVTITASTRLTRQINDNGTFREVNVTVADIKAGLLAEFTFGKEAGTVVSIKLLQ